MKLTYRTRGDSTPQGKPRVYFTGHPADLPAYSEEIFADILKTQNCAIYYDGEPNAPCNEEDLLRELEQMQLIVIPVTSRFLYQPNRARDVEFPFAMERHIPVLPLMQEQGLESAFNEKCGDLQMLNKSDPDPTALPYAEKLEKFLSSVLIGDELAEKARAAFDAYVFLSYRKKDRKYAQELMRLIHKNEFCRDIAIWYDEFLTPGENFNQAIADAMKRCHLFTLAVTPNIVEPGNYVMRLEYPEAKKSGKPILPAELVPTDRVELERFFEDIPACTNAHDEPALSAALLEAVQRLAIKENDNSPEHNFFIGYAYLNGIDVEVDRERALTLFTGAAEGGLPEAMEKLVNMYRNGDGVARDYRAAIRWQERLADYWRARYEESCTEGDGIRWAQELVDLGNYQEKQVESSAARQTYELLKVLCEKLNNQYASNETKEACAGGYRILGRFCLDKWEVAEAKDYFLRALKLREQLCEEAGTRQSWRDLAVVYTDLGDLNSNAMVSKWTEARDYYMQALELCNRLYEETGEVSYQFPLFAIYNGLSKLSSSEGKRAERIRYSLLAEQMREKISNQVQAEIGTVDEEDDGPGIPALYKFEGDNSRAEGNLTEAKGYYLQALELSKRLYAETGTEESWKDLVNSYNDLGDVSWDEGRLSEAKGYYLQCLELDEQPDKETKDWFVLSAFSNCCAKLGSICETEGNLAEAKGYYLKDAELRKRSGNIIGTVEELAAIYDKLGDISREEGNLPEAKNYYLQGMELRRQLHEDTMTMQARRNLAGSYERLSEISEAEGNLTEARSFHRKSMELDKQLDEETIKERRDLAVSYNSMGDIRRAEGNVTEAKKCYLQGFEVNRQLCKETGTVQTRRDLTVSYEKLGGSSTDEGDLAEAKKYYLQALDLRWQLYRETGTAEAQRDLAAGFDNLGNISRAEGDLARAKKSYLQSLELREQLCRETGTIEAMDDLATSYYNTGRVSETEEKKIMFKRALDIWNRLCEKCPGVPLYAERRDLAQAEFAKLEPNA